MSPIVRLRQWWWSRYANEAFPLEWLQILQDRVDFFDSIPADEKDAFLKHLQVFVNGRKWFGAAGLEITDEMKVVVGASAARMSRNMGIETWRSLGSVIIYPKGFRPPDGGHTLGQATRLGSIVLSWDSVLRGIEIPTDGHDVTIHELAHVLDLKGDHIFDGVPDIDGRVAYGVWARVLGEHYDKLVDGKTKTRLLDDYGAQNPAEFFAVVSEVFFEKPRQLKKHKPDLYRVLKKYYRIDPA